MTKVQVTKTNRGSYVIAPVRLSYTHLTEPLAASGSSTDSMQPELPYSKDGEPTAEEARQAAAALRSLAGKAGDPLQKSGAVGDFCRLYYPVSKAIEQFLPDVYRRGKGGRWTYVGASTTDGVVIYDGKWAYSNHATDPAHGRLLNAFDHVGCLFA